MFLKAETEIELSRARDVRVEFVAYLAFDAFKCHMRRFCEVPVVGVCAFKVLFCWHCYAYVH